MSDQPRIEELIVRDAVEALENPLHIEWLLPTHSGRTGDWRATLANSRTADIEATMHTDGAARSFQRQVSHKPGPKWYDKRLSHIWTVWISDPDPEAKRRRPVKQMIDALIPVLAEAEAVGTAPAELAEHVNARLVDVWQYVRQPHWRRAWVRTAHSGISLEEWLPIWAQESGYSNPQLLIDHFEDPHSARRVRVVKPPDPASNGMVYTYPGSISGGVAIGDREALITAVQERINEKTARHQLDNAPDLKWLAVMLDGGHASGQLNDHFGPPEAKPPHPFEVFGDLTFPYFDEKSGS